MGARLSHWNYRVVEDHGTFRIMEVYYDEDGGLSWCDASAPEGGSMEELMRVRNDQADCVYEQWLHIHEDENSDSKLVLWREDGEY